MKHSYILATVILFVCNSSMISQKTINAKFVDTSIKIDGVLDEDAWKNQLQTGTEFTSIFPVPNQKPSQKTIIKLVYDHDAIYMSATIYEPSRDSIMSQLMLRDQIGNTDYVGIILDTYGNGNNGFQFLVMSTGVQSDSKVTTNNTDRKWDAVWESAVSISDSGWVAEIKIPYSAIRFPSTAIQDWNVNFFRQRFVKGESYWWENVDFTMNNPILTQMGKVEGIKDIKPPIRLSLTPYATVYGLKSKDNTQTPSTNIGSSYNLGLDIKYGINDAYTLDMTLIPDFGQVRSDNEVLNLSPFEVRFSENRSFFTEGLELFDKSRIFYSRRVGSNQQLYNATKVTGRNDNGLGIGFFNAVAKEDSFDEIISGSDEPEKVVLKPLSNYNVVVFDQDLKNNSSISLTNTNVSRRGKEYHNANVTAGTFNIKNVKQSVGIQGQLGLSQIINKEDENVLGYDINLSANKLNGAFVYGGSFEQRSENYSHNDLGFQQGENYRAIGLNLAHRDFDGFWKFNQFNYWVNILYKENLKPRKFADAYISYGMWAQTKSQASFNIWGGYSFGRNDFYEPRVWGRYFQIPKCNYLGFWYGSDNRDKVRFQAYGNIFNYQDAEGWLTHTLGGSLRFRLSDKFNFQLDGSLSNNYNEKGFVDKRENSEIVFGRRDVNTISNSFGLNYTLNQKMGFDVRIRHYWSKVYYKSHYLLNEDGSVSPTDYTNFRDLSFNAFTIDANYNWRFAPGSDISIVWKRNLSGSHSDNLLDYQELNYTNGLSQLNRLPQRNSISLRISYFLDYHSNIKKVFKN